MLHGRATHTGATPLHVAGGIAIAPATTPATLRTTIPGAIMATMMAAGAAPVTRWRHTRRQSAGCQ